MPTINLRSSATVSLPADSWIVASGTGVAVLGPGDYRGRQFSIQGVAKVGPFPFAVDVFITSTAAAISYTVEKDLGAPPLALLQTEAKRKFVHVAGVLRNLGAGWGLILDGNHDQCNISAVSNSTSTITVEYANLDVKKVVSFVATPDDTLAKAGFFCGSSVGLNAAQISLKRIKNVADYVSYNGSAWVSTNSVFTPAFSAGTLTLTHEAVLTTSAGIVCSVTGRDGVYSPQAGTATGTATQVKFYDWAGTLITTPDANMKCYVNRGQYSASEDPNNINDSTFAGSNIWVMGTFELN